MISTEWARTMFGMLAELGPDPAFRGEPADPDATLHQLAAQGLERNDLRARTAQVVVDHVDQAHSPFVDVEDLEPIADPVSDRDGAGHEGNLRLVSVDDSAFVSPARPAKAECLIYASGKCLLSL